MKAIVKPALVLGLAGTLAIASMSPSEARGRGWVAAGIGLAAGAAIAGAAANSGYYNPGYYAYGYDPYDAPAPVYVAPPAYYDTNSSSYGYDSNYTGPWQERKLQGRD